MIAVIAAQMDVETSIIGGLAVVLAAALPAWITHKRLGKPNGGGTVVGEIALVQRDVKAVKEAADNAASSAATALAAATVASTSAQLAAAMSEANGSKLEELERQMQTIMKSTASPPRRPRKSASSS